MIEARYLFFILFGGIFGWVAYGLYRKHCHRPRAHFRFGVGLPYTKGDETVSLELTVKVGNAIDVTAVPQTDEVPPRPVALDGPGTWTVLSGAGTLGTELQGGVPLPADGLRQSLHVGPDLGDTLYQIRGDAAPGEPVREILDTVLVHAVALEAAGFGLTAGTEYTP